MGLEQRPDARQVGRISLDDCMWVADVDGSEPEPGHLLREPTTTGPRSCSTSGRRASGRDVPNTDRTVTWSAPVRSESQRAAMRVPFPDISAWEPSGFQIAISTQSSPAPSTSRIPSASSTAAAGCSAVSGPSQ